MLRYNILTKFFLKDNVLIITNPTQSKKIKIGYSKPYYDFFVFCEKQIFIGKTDIKSFNIPKGLLTILTYYNFFTEEKNTGSETLFFNEITYNPSKTLTSLSKKEMDTIYKKIEEGIPKNINKGYKVHKKTIEEPEIKIDNSTLNTLHSERLTKRKKTYNKEEILGIIKTIFGKREEKKLFNIKRSFFKYGSGGGLYSIYPILITRYDEVIIYDHFRGKFFIKQKKGIYQNFIKKGLISSVMNYSSYNYFLILTSHYKEVFSKYGNKGYKLLFLECGEISFMFRLLCGEKKKPHVEIQGFYDKEIQDIISNQIGLQQGNEFLPLHILAISD
ncbi:MAG: hypothetical protein WC872_03475 [Candidatus Absconditabacterales bacterium]